MALFTTTLKGQMKLLNGGHEYTKQREAKGITHWMCVKRRRGQCRGKAMSRLVGTNYMVKVYDVHNHDV